MINSVVNRYFGGLVSCIEAHGGDVIKVGEGGMNDGYIVTDDWQ